MYFVPKDVLGFLPNRNSVGLQAKTGNPVSDQSMGELIKSTFGAPSRIETTKKNVLGLSSLDAQQNMHLSQ